MPDAAAPILEATGLVKHYDGRKVLAGIDVRIAPGETLALLGANGSGKSTLLRILAATVRPDHGTVRVSGHDAKRDPELARRHLSLLVQDPPLYDELTAAEHLAWWGRLTGRPIDPLADLEAAGLALAAHRPAGTLSRGQRQRLALCLALAGEPAVVLLDEPFTALDTQGRAWLEGRLAQRRGRVATLLVLHDADDARRLADQVHALHHGVLEAPR